jgi:WD40 repeat protein/serine/threonine protein kinase
MSADDALVDTASTDDDELMRLLEACLAEIEAGRAIDLERLTADHPALARRLRACLAGLCAVEEEGATMARAVVAATPEPRRRRLGDYLLLHEVGRGGMGIVYEAEQLSLGRRVAVKVLPLAATLDPRHLQRFQNEARAAAGLQHPHIVPVHAVGCEDGVYFYVMQLIDGRTLADPAQPESGTEPAALGSQSGGGAAPQPGPAIDVRTAARLGVQAAEALEHAHQLGVVHRDVKPANLLVDQAGHLWVTDFGLALLRQDGRLTKTGDVVGTLHYMSPEQTAASRGLVDHRTDVYSLGATLYELLTGRPPFDVAFRPELLRQILEDEPRPLRRLNAAVPPDLETIILKCLAKAPTERYATAQDLADDLRRVLEDRPIQARCPSPWQRASKWAWRNRKAVGVAFVLLALAVVGLAVSTALVWQAKQQAETALDVKNRKVVDLKVALAEERRSACGYFVTLAAREWEDGKAGRMGQLLEACQPDTRRWEWRYLRQLLHADLGTLWDHTDTVTCVALSPDGRWLATGSRDHTIKLRDAGTGVATQTLDGGQHPVLAVAFTPDGQAILTADSEGWVKVWRLADGTVLRSWRGHEKPIHGLSVSADGQLVATASEDATAKVWDLATGEERCTLTGYAGTVWCAAFAPAGAPPLLAASDSQGLLKVWDVRTGTVVFSRQQRNASVAVSFSPDGQCLAVTGGSQVALLDVATWRQRGILQGHTNSIMSMAFHPDSRHLATASYDCTVRVWDAATGRKVNSFRGHTGAVFAVVFSGDGRRVISAGADRTVKFWDATANQERRLLAGHEGKVPGVAFSPDGGRLASVGWDRTVRLWRVPGGGEPVTLEGHRGNVDAVAFSPDGRLLATGGPQTILLWDPASGRKVHELRTPGRVSRLAWRPDGHELAVASFWTNEDRALCSEVNFWDPETGQLVHTIRNGGGAWCGVAYSPDGRYLALGDTFTCITVREVAGGREVFRCQGADLQSRDSIIFSPDGRRLAAAGPESGVCVWDATPAGAVEERGPLLTLVGHARPVQGLAFSRPEGNRLASASMDGTVKVWEVDNGWEVLTLHGDGSENILDVTFSPDGHLLAAGSSNGKVLIWDGRPLDAPGAGKDE